MEKQTVYIRVAKTTYYVLHEKHGEIYSGDSFLEKKENVYVFTSQEFEKAIGDAFGAGYKNGFDIGIKGSSAYPNKTEYLNNLK